MTTITWKISSIQTSQESETFFNKITSVGWIVVGANESNVEFESGFCDLTSPDSLAFKQLENISEEDVVLWVKKSIGIDRVNDIEQMLTSKLNLRSGNFMLDENFPWNA